MLPFDKIYFFERNEFIEGSLFDVNDNIKSFLINNLYIENNFNPIGHQSKEYVSLNNLHTVKVIYQFNYIMNIINEITIFISESKEISHDEYKLKIIKKINHVINYYENNKLLMFELFEQYDNNGLRYIQKKRNRLELFLKGKNSFPQNSTCLLNTDVFNINHKGYNTLIRDVNMTLNTLENIRRNILCYFETGIISFSSGNFEKNRTNLARKTLLEKTDLEIKLHSNIHTRKNIK